MTAKSTRAPRTEGQALAVNATLALLVAALGLLVAASLSLTTNAQAAGGTAAARTAAIAATDPTQAGTSDRPSRSAAVRTALVQEVAAQRAEQLAKTAESVDRSAAAASGEARQAQLSEADQQAQTSAAALAKQRLADAIAARQAAEAAAAANPDDPSLLDPTGTATTTTIPAGTLGVSPVPGAVIGAHFGQYGLWSRYHTGLDFRASYGTPIKAVQAGVVLYAGNSGDWAGNHVAVKHADGQTTMYSHMSSMAATAGQTVQAGQVIGYVGQTGRAFGAHLHFELYPAGIKYGDVYEAIDPAPWLRSIGVQTR